MWSFARNMVAGKFGSENTCAKSSMPNPDCSDDEISSCTSKEEGLECPICWESFNIVENVPYVLWCGHTLCKNCVLGLKWAVVKLPTVPIQLPFIISCPWCNTLSLRLIYKGNLTFPRKNYFLLWMVESMNCDRPRSDSIHEEHHPVWPSSGNLPRGSHGSQHHIIRRAPYMHAERLDHNQTDAGSANNYFNTERIHASLCKSLALFVQFTAKFPLVIIFLLIVLYAIPASVAILVLYILITVLFALPSFLMLYFAYPILDWLVREILT
ncbi:Ring zinc finger protein-like [Musa troglodytarum]|uniref:Ring zinc finger protein-like n=1 Tax=Musa troglodytarum TaxID=320322 RepID=A0A9E7JC11_9LILI|nr:Ring zinc finger protein-like [Musa troglodytarum]URD75601.1 Ring zinc finger protein-like [Musa troglodytarum]